MDELIVVVGMHRSGTSLAAHLVHELGVTALGARSRLVRADPFNSQGYWESPDLVTVNTYLCNFLGCDWRHPVVPPDGWHLSRPLQPLRRQLIRLFEQTASGHRSVKDPRMAITLPFWQALVPHSATVVCLRSPVSVALSLDLREHMAARWALGLWTVHTALAVRNTKSRRRLFVVYEDLVKQSAAQAGRIAAFVGANQERAREVAADVVDRDLNHSAADMLDTVALTTLGSEGKGAARLWHAALAARAGEWREGPVRTLEATAEEALSRPALRPPAAAYQCRHRLRFLIKTMRMVSAAAIAPSRSIVLPSSRTVGPIRRIDRPGDY